MSNDNSPRDDKPRPGDDPTSPSVLNMILKIVAFWLVLSMAVLLLGFVSCSKLASIGDSVELETLSPDGRYTVKAVLNTGIGIPPLTRIYIEDHSIFPPLHLIPPVLGGDAWTILFAYEDYPDRIALEWQDARTLVVRRPPNLKKAYYNCEEWYGVKILYVDWDPPVRRKE